MVRSRWRTKLLATLYILLVDLVVILLQELILKLDHGWSHLGMFIVDVLLVYILHGYFHWRLFSCVLLGVAITDKYNQSAGVLCLEAIILQQFDCQYFDNRSGCDLESVLCKHITWT